MAKIFQLGGEKGKSGVKWISLGIVLWLVMAISVAQELPSGGGPIPALRRGSGGQLELAPPSAAPRREANRPNPADGAPAPPSPNRKVRTPSANAAPPQPVITVTPVTPRVPDTTPRGAAVATYSIAMSDGSPFRGAVRFGPPNYDGHKVFALSGNKIIVNPGGPGLRRSKTTVIHRITLETIP